MKNPHILVRHHLVVLMQFVESSVELAHVLVSQSILVIHISNVAQNA